MNKIQNFMMLVLTSQASYYVGEQGTTCADVGRRVVATMEDCQTAHTELGLTFGSVNEEASGNFLPYDTVPVGGYFWTGDITWIQVGCSRREPLQYSEFGPASLHFNENLDSEFNSASRRSDLSPICVELETTTIDTSLTASYTIGEQGTTCADISLDVVATMMDCRTAHTELGLLFLPGALNEDASGNTLPYDTAPAGGYFWTGHITSIQAGCSSREPLQYTEFAPASLHFNRNLDSNSASRRYDLSPICVEWLETTPVVVVEPVVPVSRVCIADPDEACRGSCAICSGNYDMTTGVATVEQCQELCFAEPLCTGYEYAPDKQGGYCEVWKSPIQFTAAVTGYTCHVCQDVDDTTAPTATPATPTPTPAPVTDASDPLDCVATPDRACRGSCATCNGDYAVSTGVTVEQCKELCFAEPLCTGYEYAPSKQSGYCEVWKSPIQFTAAVTGYTCNVCSAPTSRRLSSRFQALAKQIKN